MWMCTFTQNSSPRDAYRQPGKIAHLLVAFNSCWTSRDLVGIGRPAASRSVFFGFRDLLSLKFQRKQFSPKRQVPKGDLDCFQG